MSQYTAWEKEYKNPQLVSKNDEPQMDVKRYFKFLKKQGIQLSYLAVLDLGSGTGRNANYLAELGNKVVGMELSATALRLAATRAKVLGVEVEYIQTSIGEKYNFSDNYFDLVLDVTSSNSLSERERDIYLAEVFRVLKPGGNFFVRALCKDGDSNVKALLKKFPGPEPDTYINKEMKLVEKVFSKEEFVKRYSKHFNILELEKKTSYTRFNNKSYKRNFWLGYLQKS